MHNSSENVAQPAEVSPLPLLDLTGNRATSAGCATAARRFSAFQGVAQRHGHDGSSENRWGRLSQRTLPACCGGTLREPAPAISLLRAPPYDSNDFGMSAEQKTGLLSSAFNCVPGWPGALGLSTWDNLPNCPTQGTENRPGRRRLRSGQAVWLPPAFQRRLFPARRFVTN